MYFYSIRFRNGFYLQTLDFDSEDNLVITSTNNISDSFMFKTRELADSCCDVLSENGFMVMPIGYGI